MVDVLGVEEGDIEMVEGKKLSKLEHGVNMALPWTRKEHHMGNSSSFCILLHLSSLWLFFLGYQSGKYWKRQVQIEKEEKETIHKVNRR